MPIGIKLNCNYQFECDDWEGPSIDGRNKRPWWGKNEFNRALVVVPIHLLHRVSEWMNGVSVRRAVVLLTEPLNEIELIHTLFLNWPNYNSIRLRDGEWTSTGWLDSLYHLVALKTTAAAAPFNQRAECNSNQIKFESDSGVACSRLLKCKWKTLHNETGNLAVRGRVSVWLCRIVNHPDGTIDYFSPSDTS